MENPKLTQFSHGSGCGCKIAPADLQAILGNLAPQGAYPQLLVGSSTKDDAAVYDLGNGQAMISTTDFFMPIVDDAFDFGRIAAANAISDVYAMGGKPVMAIAILGWPVEALGTSLASEVLAGARAICDEAGIPLAGGHSIDSKEPFFGLAVTGTVDTRQLKQNSGARVGDRLYLTKPLGVGIVSTAMTRGVASAAHVDLIIKQMSALNSIGASLGNMDMVHAVTDVTGFGLLGHLIEVCEGSDTSAQLDFDQVPLLPPDVLDGYMKQFIMPDNTMRNFKAYGAKCSKLDARQLQLLCDPQTNGGLLIAVAPEGAAELEQLLKVEGCYAQAIGSMLPPAGSQVVHVSG